MRSLFPTALATVLLFAFTIQTTSALSPSSSPTNEAVNYRLHENSEIVVVGTSNVRDWTMDVTEVTGTFLLRETMTGNPSVALEFDRVQVRVPVESMKSGRSGQDSKVYETLRSNSYPVIHYNARRTQVVSSEGSTMTVRTEGTLIVAGQQRPIAIDFEGTRRDDGSLHFQGTKDLTFSDLGLDRPTAMLGALRVGDEFSIEFDIILVEES